jgi:hypothetical protein
MGLGIARGTIDYATTHTGGDTHIAPAETLYVGGAGATVFVNGFPAIVQGDIAICGDIAVGCSGTVFIGGRGVHRLNDALDSHVGTYTPSVCAVAAVNVFAG